MKPQTLLMLLISSGALAWPSLGAGQPANDTLTYELVRATIDSEPGHKGFIAVEFGRTLPTRYLQAGGQTLSPAPEWIIETREIQNPASVTTVTVASVFVENDPALNRLVSLQPATPLDFEKFQIRVRLLQANFPEVVLNQPTKQGAAAFYGPAKGKDDADLYFKGLVVATTGSGPAYSIDSKAGYTRGVGSNGGSLGFSGTYIVDKASDIGPDTITVNATYSKVFVWAAATGLIINADPLGFEFDADNDTRNLRTAALAQFVFPSALVRPKSYVTADITAGFEGGQNHASKVSEDSLGGFWRTIIGANGYLLLQGLPNVPRIDITASWKVRALAQAEPFTDLQNGAQVTELTDKARHIVTVNAALMINKALGFSIGYRHGSEPPVYKNVRHRAEVGLVLKLKQIDKG